MNRLVCIIIWWSVLIPSASAQHPIDVQRLSAAGKHFEALAAYEHLAKRSMPTQATIAAGRSAWAMGLPEAAMARFNSALQDKNLSAVERARTNIMKGIVSFQEKKFQDALLYGERALTDLSDASPLRAKAYLLIGQAHEEMKQPGKAEQFLRNAVQESDSSERPESLFLLSKTLLALGKSAEARAHLEGIPAGDDRSPEAMRMLAEIALESKEYKSVEFWLNHGRTHYPDLFLDSWVDYALLQSAIQAENLERVRTLRSEALTKYAPSDPWLTLLDAAAETYEWQQSRRSSPGGTL